ncbi:flavin reductase family protein [Streptomyces sp. ST2-7A]|uniref:flavin reductase family protein n=1 Tax=Streptomyces sp. ST2-7A TaxID=2907214 RepID=UPI001F1C3203|nr:flavin reductase family protein [Streptomyces sp. ST2-7A]MCE7079505.1 flavin reductase family protein [Streptomyces sp. ST2-7A]
MNGQGARDVLPDPKRLRNAFGTFATGVTVVTVGGARPRGMTANSFTAVSLDPPLVLVCVGREAVMNGLLERAETFGISVLSAEQEEVARHFANPSRPDGADQFEPVAWTAGTAADAPLLDGAVAHFECERWREYDGGDHAIHIGRVLGMAVAPERDGLVFHRGRFATLAAAPRGVPA